MILRDILRECYRKFRPIVVKGKNNIILLGKYRHKENFFITITGNNNKIIIHDRCRLDNTSIILNGDNNFVEIDENVKFRGPCIIHLEGEASLKIKSEAGIRGVTFSLRNAKIEIGRKCMFSYNVLLRNHDSHKVIDLATDSVTNPPCDIVVGDHVWFAQNGTVLKGVTIGSDSIIAFGSVVTKDCPSNSIIAGNSAKIVKRGISWDY